MKNTKSLICNILLCILEIIGLVVLYKDTGILYEYYTVDSNILCLVSSLLMVIFLLKNKKIPRWLSFFKYISTVSLAITFIVVIFILIPMTSFNFKYLLFENALLYQHLLCPILAIITFVFFDQLGNFEVKDTIKGLLFTFIYTIVLIPLNLFDIVLGPYPFLMVKEQTIFMDLIWFFIMMGISTLISFILLKSYMRKVLTK